MAETMRRNRIKIYESRLQSYFTKIQSFYDLSQNLNTSDEISNFIGCTSNISKLRSLFMEQVEEINLLKLEDNPSFEPSFKQWESFDTLCSHVENKIKSLTLSAKTESGVSSNSIRLPPIQLINFQGDAKSWPIFIESYNNIIHRNKQLSRSEKVYYLCGQLSGKALDSIAGISPTGANYDLIYETLVDKYQDVRSLGTAYLDEIFSLKKMQVSSSDGLNAFIDKFSISISAFEVLEIKNKLDFIYLYMALKKVDIETARLFESSVRGEKVPTYQNFVKFVKEQTKIIERTGDHVAVSKKIPSHDKVPVPRSYRSKISSQNTRVLVTAGMTCPLCSATDHDNFVRCTEFLKLSAKERYTVVKKYNGCVNCLSFTHKFISCNSTAVCNTCQSKTHHSLLHFPNGNSAAVSLPVFNNYNVDPLCPVDGPLIRHTDVSSVGDTRVSESADGGVSLCSLHSARAHTSTRSDLSPSSMLLATARVCVVDSSGRMQMVRCLIDSGSQNHFITERCLKRLALPSHSLAAPVSVHGFGGGSNLVKGETELEFSSRFNSKLSYKIRPLVVNYITDRLPMCTIDKSTLSYLSSVPLADDTFEIPGEIEMLIGAQLFSRLLLSGRVYSPPGNPDAVQTTLGFILMGEAPIFIESKRVRPKTLCAFTSSPIEDTVRKFWELEEVSSCTAARLSREEQECERFYIATTSRDSTGRYTVALPFRTNPQDLGSSLAIAERRFFALERKLQSSLQLRTAYNNIVKEYLEQGFLSPVRTVKDEGYIIPHHGVIRNDKVTTKLRIVLDASAPTDKGLSLNQVLHCGPNLQGDIFLLLLNFRLFPIAFCADVKQMYLQIKLQAAYSKYLRILYRFDPNDKLQMFEFSRVCFGLSVSPFLALRTMRQLCEDEHHNFPLAASVLQTHMYMDDVVSSERSVSTATKVATQLVDMFKAGGFDLMKWSSNSMELLSRLPESHLHPQSVIFSDDSSQKILGVKWEPKSDTFMFDITPCNKVCTKRNILSAVARLWDVLGFAAPVILYAKLLIQELWALKIDWDETPPQSIIEKWKRFEDELPLVAQLSIPRHVGVIDNCVVTLLAFADASERAYGCVIYLHVQSQNSVEVNLLCAKSKVAPLKPISLARLELCAALLMSKLVRTVLENYASRYQIDRVLAFSDSTVTLHWIHSSPHRWKTFVANRIAQIHENLDESHFYHISGKDNPSDCLSRGLTPAQLEDHPLWFRGPFWVRQNSACWQLQPFKFDNIAETDILEAKTIAAPTVQQDIPLLYVLAHRMSSWQKCLRVIVYVLRFIRKLTSRGFPNGDDLNQAELVVIRALQSVHFADTIMAIQSGKPYSKPIQRLRPILVDGIMRVGGRLENSDVTFDHKYPILLPKKDHIVNLVIDYVHRQNCHTGPHLLLSLLRQRFWILSGRNIVRSRVHACNFCFKVRPKACIAPVMANLPECRLQLSKPFAHTGLDYGGPINITLTRRRGVKSQKAYICAFICLTTRAVHVEVAPDLSTDSFLNALKRFLSRRGPIEKLYSDNGTNFVGARAYLDELNTFLHSPKFTEAFTCELANRRINWQMIPPNAPHFGGGWEVTIKVFKSHLFRVIGRQILTYEELLTVLCQIEAVLNSRPLGHIVGSDPSEPVALTPAHFLHSVPLSSLPAAPVSDKADHLISRYLLLDKLVQSYWHRWSLEYLHTLQTREKWLVDPGPIQKGTVVLIMENNAPPLHWPLGVIQQTYPGKDRRTRVVLVKTKTGTLTRPVVRLCPLPTQ